MPSHNFDNSYNCRNSVESFTWQPKYPSSKFRKNTSCLLPNIFFRLEYWDSAWKRESALMACKSSLLSRFAFHHSLLFSNRKKNVLPRKWPYWRDLNFSLFVFIKFSKIEIKHCNWHIISSLTVSHKLPFHFSISIKHKVMARDWAINPANLEICESLHIDKRSQSHFPIYNKNP